MAQNELKLGIGLYFVRTTEQNRPYTNKNIFYKPYLTEVSEKYVCW